ncbi:hypothetical protein BV22DRAFT_1118347 [Leucogyrophana mollusca]|uniref:Uncharacterized protein n=1 Tax=Leucogyrophana mollusca TaxID=85980 RepID=A0ACB8BP12_9AGAM|nr:hypothetical protein BV22DRAFT_1118347 [Leucogyrophana mollusca]
MWRPVTARPNKPFHVRRTEFDVIDRTTHTCVRSPSTMTTIQRCAGGLLGLSVHRPFSILHQQFTPHITPPTPIHQHAAPRYTPNKPSKGSWLRYRIPLRKPRVKHYPPPRRQVTPSPAIGLRHPEVVEKAGKVQSGWNSSRRLVHGSAARRTCFRLAPRAPPGASLPGTLTSAAGSYYPPVTLVTRRQRHTVQYTPSPLTAHSNKAWKTLGYSSVIPPHLFTDSLMALWKRLDIREQSGHRILSDVTKRISNMSTNLETTAELHKRWVYTKKPNVFAGLLVFIGGDQPPEGWIERPHPTSPLLHPRKISRYSSRSLILSSQACFLFGNLAPRSGVERELSISAPTARALLVKSRATSFLHRWVWR